MTRSGITAVDGGNSDNASPAGIDDRARVTCLNAPDGAYMHRPEVRAEPEAHCDVKLAFVPPD